MNNERFDFDEIIDRRHTHSVKWDFCPSDDVIPMWVADMDFKAAPCIIDALKERLEHGVFGYANVPEEFYDSIIKWTTIIKGYYTIILFNGINNFIFNTKCI